NGTVAIVNGGTAVRYTRTNVGDDSFTYTISDGHGHTATATITIYDTPPPPNQAPTANPDIATYYYYGPFGNSLTFDPRANDTDPDNDPLTIISATALYGTATIVNGGTAITYTGTGSSDQVTYTISDGHGHTASSTVILMSGNPANRAPVAHN